MKRITFFILLNTILIFAVPFWTTDDFYKAETEMKAPALFQNDIILDRGDWQSWSYIHELIQTAGFVASMQVSDTLDPEYGGIIEGEDATGIIETDNTQQAIWVWCRYYELTGDSIYFHNIDLAWIYVLSHPAYREEGIDSDYYRVWNCGLALFAELKYREVSGDSSYRPYVDTCITYMLAHPLPFDSIDQYYRRLHPKTTSLAAGMLYQYAKSENNQVLKDTAIVYGDRVRNWIEIDPVVNINDEIWAMSGGTAVWGLCRSIFDADTSTGVIWLTSNLPYMKFLQPNGTWNNAWNIWYANAYNYAARILNSSTYVEYHHALTDSLLVQDYDDDGGVPPTRGWTQNQDHSWVSNYMFFMGFNGLIDSLKNYDAGVNNIIAVGPRPFMLIGDTVRIAAVIANCGFELLNNTYVEINGVYTDDTIISLTLGAEDTCWFSDPWIPQDTGLYNFTAYCNYIGDQRPSNDTFSEVIMVRPLRLVQGSVKDSTASTSIKATLSFQFIDASGDDYFAVVQTDSFNGTFSVNLIDSLYRVRVATDIPYPDFIKDNVLVSPDSVTALDFQLNPCDLMLVNRDNEGRYSEYYISALDSLGLDCKTWTPSVQGLFPASRVDEFNFPLIVWFTGRAVNNTVTPAEQDSLMFFINNGGKLLLSGQNVGEDISTSIFYSDYLHAQLVDDSIYSLKCFPDSTDSLGQRCGKLYTVGMSGAGNQFSRDVIQSDGESHEFLFYDSLLASCAALWHNDTVSGGQVVYCAFGLEAVHKPILWLDYMNRSQIMHRILAWFEVLGVDEQARDIRVRIRYFAYPSMACEKITIYTNNNFFNKSTIIKVFDVVGRTIKIIIPENDKDRVYWDLTDRSGQKVSSGVFFIRIEDSIYKTVLKVVVLN